MLITLKIHVTDNIDYLDSDAFLGLNTVKTLDLNDCVRVSLKQIIPAFRGTDKLPRLEELFLSNFGIIRPPTSIDSLFSLSLKGKNITHLDVSMSQISMFNVTAIVQDLNHLKVLNLSYSTVGDVFTKEIKVSDLMHMNLIVDGSHAVFPKAWFSEPFGKIIISNYTIENIDPRGHLKLFFACKVINATGILSVPNSVWVENCKVNIENPITWSTRGVIARHNNIKRLDINIHCSNYKAINFEHTDISNNGMEFIHPSILKCVMPNISRLDMSGNQLFKMEEESSKLFEEIFQSLAKLCTVSLSRNNLDIIPTRMFKNNVKLKEIDLSHNKLNQITFKLWHLKNLRILDLRGNHLHVLDAKSIKTLNSIPQNSNRSYSSALLLLEDNPFSCSKCTTKRFIQWLTTTHLLNRSSQHLTCSMEDGSRDNITTATVEMIQKICNRKIVTIATSISSGVFSLIIGVSIFVVYKRKKHARKMAKLENVLQNLTEGQGQFEFVTFLSYSSNDKDFVEMCLYNQLNENLKIMTGIERNLVCTGDGYLRLGFNILDETARCIERASVVIAVVSNSYCESSYCHTELDQAYRLNKPIILMLKEHVGEELMMPTMKMLFKNNVRMLWTVENGEYVLKTTWQNVCTSVLELIVRDV
ncbi:toll-like receptor 4 [Mercenaria mercenaria]|uniref:toll-like receptor 4 n=1 Tax=Mercenaria mercenaria TaxID=6596 RepID=UPI00234F7FA6|nr:toll-like receptor 4 [Mercenaria mercenaria]